MFIIRYENYFTSFISYISIIYKCFYLFFQCCLVKIVNLFNDIFRKNQKC
jgi:hypothetical protein